MGIDRQDLNGVGGKMNHQFHQPERFVEDAGDSLPRFYLVGRQVGQRPLLCSLLDLQYELSDIVRFLLELGRKKVETVGGAVTRRVDGGFTRSGVDAVRDLLRLNDEPTYLKETQWLYGSPTLGTARCGTRKWVADSLYSLPVSVSSS